MAGSQFVYVTYIRTTAEKLWNALLIDAESTKKVWMGTHIDSAWTKGAAWQLINPEGKLVDGGEIVELVPHEKLVLTWQHESKAELKAEGVSRLTVELETSGGVVKLTVVHEMGLEGSQLIKAVSTGWPKILSSLKSLLETGEAVEGVRSWAKECVGAG